MDHRLTTNQGAPVADNQNSKTAGRRGPALLEDYHLIEKIAHFDRERIPERVVHARGAGAHGVFVVENNMKPYTRAAFLQEIGQETPVFVRFSTVIHGTSSPETARDPRGFSVKFYTEEGNYDIVGLHIPVFFIRDAIKFPDMVHSLKPSPESNIQEPGRYWDFMTLSPESTHMMTWLFSDHGTPANYREIDGFSVHAFKWVNAEGKVTYIKYKWESQQGVSTMDSEKVVEVQGRDFNHATRDLRENIAEGNFPKWRLLVQMMSPEEMDDLSFDPLDPTKIWPEDRFPYMTIGTMTLNHNPQNFFAEVEQAAFSPSALVPGIEPSEDKMLQGRLFSYPDTQRHRLGPNYMQIPINCPYAPVRNYQRDGLMNVKQDPSPVNYEPNSYTNSPIEDPSYAESEAPLSGYVTRQKIEKTADFTQAGELYRSFTLDQKDNLLRNLVSDLSQVKPDIQMRALCNFFRADAEFGGRLAAGLGVDINAFIPGVPRG